jgi:hypothetical protein
MTPVLPDEDASAFEELRQQLFAEYEPDTALEIELVEDLTCLLWRLRRIPSMEAGILQVTHHQQRPNAAHDAVSRAESQAKSRASNFIAFWPARTPSRPRWRSGLANWPGMDPGSG